VHAVRDALLDERPGEHVLDAVADSPGEPHRAREASGEPDRREAEPEALQGDGRQRDARHGARPDAARNHERAEHHADGP
jgi:hypothetical protein